MREPITFHIAASIGAGLTGITMDQSYYKKSYDQLLHSLLASQGEEKAMDLVVGGQKDQFGALEYSLLLNLGLRPEHCVVDVGCGSGRLAVKLSKKHTGKYIGTDILPELLNYAKQAAGRPDWEFLCTDSSAIPALDECADFVCFFSLFTHLLDEDSYRYLRDAKRVVKRGGKIVVSFLDFAEPWHWPVFESTVADQNPNKVLNKFLSKDALQAWCGHLDLQILDIHTGSEDWIKIDEPITYINGRTVSGITGFGQSVAIIEKI